MVNPDHQPAVFLVVGVGLQVLTAGALLVMFRHRGWLSSDGTVPPATPADRPRVARDKRWYLLHPPKGSQAVQSS